MADVRRFRSVVSALFGARRKTAATALRKVGRTTLTRAAALAALRAADIPEQARADGLSVPEIIALANALA